LGIEGMQTGDLTSTARLGDYFVLLRRRWLIVLFGLLVGLGGAIAYLNLAAKEYTSQTSVLVTSMTVGGSDVLGGRAEEINLDTEAQLVTATDTVRAAADKLGLPADRAGDIADRVRVSVPPNTEILDISYVAGTAADARRGSLAFAEAYLDQRETQAREGLESEDKALQSRIDAVNAQLSQILKAAAGLQPGTPDRSRADEQATALSGQLASLTAQQGRIRAAAVTPGRIVTQPALPGQPSSPDLLVTLAAGVVLGLLFGIGLAALRHRADDLIRTPEDLFRRTRVPVVTVLASRLHSGEVIIRPPLSADGRGYARLRNLVSNSLAHTDRRVVVVAGVRHGGGPVAANLAASLARAGEDVVLVCADVFGNTAAALVPGPGGQGLAEVLAEEVAPQDVARAIPRIPGMRVLGPGRDPDRADALLQTRSLRKLVDQLLAVGSYVVIEAPATSDSPDAQTLAHVAGLGVIVVETGDTSARAVLDACAQFESMGTQVLGAVLTRYGRDTDVDEDEGSDEELEELPEETLPERLERADTSDRPESRGAMNGEDRRSIERPPVPATASPVGLAREHNGDGRSPNGVRLPESDSGERRS
jgi:Mrp family chromosome partitioning ATPase/capsular polysaccharide biosynthesis protein